MKEKIKENKYFQIGLSAFIVLAAGITFYFIIFKMKDIFEFIGTVISLFTPFIIGFVFAYLLNPIVNFFDKKVFDKLIKDNKKLSNVLSIVLTLFLFLGILILLFSFIIPELLKSIEQLAINLPAYFEDTKKYLLNSFSSPELKTIIVNNYEAINNYLTNIINTSLLPQIDKWLLTLSNGVFGAVKVIFNIVMGFVISVYYLADKTNFIAGIKKVIYSIFNVRTANNIMENTRQANDIFGDFITGKLLDGLIVGTITFIFLTIFGYPYALLIGVLIGITNMIPYFGPYIGTIPSALLILMDNPSKCLVFILFIIGLQQIDSYVIEPRVCGSRTGLKSFWVLASILFFGNVFGIVGMILGVPIFAIIYRYLDNLFLTKLKKKNLPISSDEYLDTERINSRTNKLVKFEEK